MKLTGAMRFALGQVQRHGCAHSTRSLLALERRGLVACTGLDSKRDKWILTSAGRAFVNQEVGK